MNRVASLVRSGRIVIPALLVIGLVTLTDPQRLPSFMLVMPFALLFGVLYLLVYEAIGWARRGDKVVGLRLRRPRILAALAAGFPVLLLVLQSIGQLSWWDVAVAVLIIVIAYLYVARSGVRISR